MNKKEEIQKVLEDSFKILEKKLIECKYYYINEIGLDENQAKELVGIKLKEAEKAFQESMG